MVLASTKVGLLASLLPTASYSFHAQSLVGQWNSRKELVQHDNRNSALLAAPSSSSEPQGLWKALDDLSSEIIPPANAMDDPFPGIGISIDRLYGNVESKVETAVKAVQPVTRAAEPARTATESVETTDQVASTMEKTSAQVSKAFDSAFNKASEPVVLAASTPAAQQATEQVVPAESVAQAVEPIVQNSESIMKSTEPVVMAATPVAETGAFAVKHNDGMLETMEMNSALSKSISDAVHDSVDKLGSAFKFQAPDLSLYSNKGAMAGVAGVDFTGMFDNIKFNFEVPSAESIKFSPIKFDFELPSAESINFSPEQFKISPEQMEATRQNMAEFGKEYLAALESYYKLSEFQHAIVTGTAVNEALGGFLSTANDLIEKMDFEHNSGWYVSLVTFFWASTQRKEGEMYGKLISEQKIAKIESQLATTKRKADKEASKKANEVAELKEEMVALKSQVQLLADNAKDVSKQLEQARMEQTKAEQAKAEQAKAEQAKAEQAKAEQAKAEQAKAEQAKAEQAKAEQAAAEPPTEAVEAPEPVNIEEEIEVTSKPSPAKKTKTKGATKKETEEVNNSPVAEKKGKRKTVKVKGTKSQVTTEEKSTEPKEAPPKIAMSSGDWSQLAESTLKRKTVKELIGYLSEKGMDVKDEDGKTLKKDNLVELVLTK